MSSAPILRDDWDAVSDAFRRFFVGIGEVSAGEESLTFRADETGLSLNRDGTSHSFMPLHELGARWQSVRFDEDTHVVELQGGDVTYRYRVPPGLVELADGGSS